jgi:hypothetical protein
MLALGCRSVGEMISNASIVGSFGSFDSYNEHVRCRLDSDNMIANIFKNKTSDSRLFILSVLSEEMIRYL